MPTAKSTFYEITQRASSVKRKSRFGKRTVVLTLVMILVCGAVFAGVAQADFSAWADYSNDYSDVVEISGKLGITVPEKLSDSPFYDISTLYVVPEGTSWLEALKAPAYKWYSVQYGIENIVHAEDGKGYSPELNDKIILSFGDINNELWEYVFYTGDACIDEVEYEGVVLRITADVENNCAVRWVDNNVVYVLRTPENDISGLVDIAKYIISLNH